MKEYIRKSPQVMPHSFPVPHGLMDRRADVISTSSHIAAESNTLEGFVLFSREEDENPPSPPFATAARPYQIENYDSSEIAAHFGGRPACYSVPAPAGRWLDVRAGRFGSATE
jgi:hypothetical protein